MSTTTTEPTRKNAPRPTPDTPLYPYGDYLADADGYLYKPTGEPVALDGVGASGQAEVSFDFLPGEELVLGSGQLEFALIYQVLCRPRPRSHGS